MKLCNIIKNDVAAILGGYKSLYTPLVYAPDVSHDVNSCTHVYRELFDRSKVP